MAWALVPGVRPLERARMVPGLSLGRQLAALGVCSDVAQSWPGGQTVSNAAFKSTFGGLGWNLTSSTVVTVGDPSPVSDACSVSLWWYGARSSSNVQTLWSTRSSLATGICLKLAQWTAATKYGITVAGWGDYTDGALNPTTVGLHHIAVARDVGGTGSIRYLADGALTVGANNYPATTPDLSGYVAGGYHRLGSVIDPVTDAVVLLAYAVWRRALSVGELYALFAPATRWQLYGA